MLVTTAVLAQAMDQDDHSPGCLDGLPFTGKEVLSIACRYGKLAFGQSACRMIKVFRMRYLIIRHGQEFTS